MAVRVSLPRLWAQDTSPRIYSVVMPGTVPGAGMSTTSAPAPINARTSSSVMIFSPLSASTPAACIFPAMSITRSLNSCRNFRSVWMIAAFVTPTPGLPVRTIKSTPMSMAFRAFSTVAARPEVRCHSPFVSTELSTSSSRGSRLIPTARPVSHFTSRITSSGAVSGSPCTSGLFTSNKFRISRSAPMAQANSALVTSPSIGRTAPMVSHTRSLPSLPAMASISCALSILRISDAVQFKYLFPIISSPLSLPRSCNI